MSEKPDLFPETHWSTILAAASRDPERIQEGVRRLCETYRNVIYRWFSFRVNPETADDLTHQFLVKFLNLQATSEPSLSFCRGKERFRNYLERSLSNFLIQNHRHASALKRGGNAPHVEFADSDFSSPPVSSHFTIDLGIAREIYSKVSESVISQVQAPDRRKLTAALLKWVLQPGDSPNYAGMSAQFHLSVPALRIALLRVRRLHHATFRARVAEFTPQEQIADEHAHLIGLLLKYGPDTEPEPAPVANGVSDPDTLTAGPGTP